jgi:hypothetical protein
MTLKPDGFTVSQSEASAVRKCPFCAGLIEDAQGNNINFIVHLGTPFLEHQSKQAWADYLSFMHRI